MFVYICVCVCICVFYIFYCYFLFLIYHGLTMSCFATTHQSACFFYKGMRTDVKCGGEQKGLSVCEVVI